MLKREEIMKRVMIGLAIGIALTLSTLAQQLEVVTVLQGFDPIELTQGREVKGDAMRSVTRGTYRYVFANEANQRKFKQSPERYQIQFGGGCGQMGSLSGVGNPDRFFVFDQRIYIFASEQCRNGFKAAPEKHLEAPDAPPTGTIAEHQRGQQLLQRALNGLGGAKAVDGVRTYQAHIKLAYRQKDKVLEYPQTITLALPGNYRNEYNWGSGASGDVLTAQGATSFSAKGKTTREEPVRAALERALYRHPLAILQARRARGFIAVAGSKDNLDGVEIEWLKVGYKGATTALALDAQGRILRTAYRDRNGAYGDVIKTFLDFRPVEGLTLPFKVEESFDGKPVKSPAVTYEKIILNGKLETSLFARQ
jgi:YHS domain-containing protein